MTNLAVDEYPDFLSRLAERPTVRPWNFLDEVLGTLFNMDRVAHFSELEKFASAHQGALPEELRGLNERVMSVA